SYWKKFSNRQTMPEGAGFMQATIVIHGADGAPEASYGIDDVRLELVESVKDTSNYLANPGFEQGATENGVPVGWIGYAQTGASIEFKSDMATAHSGVNWVKCTSTLGGYYLLYQNSFPAKEGQTWKFSSYFKDLSPAFPGANFAALKISAKSITGSTFQYWEIFPDSVTTEWAQYSNEQKLPEGTAYIQAVIVIHGADGAPEASYGIDDVKLELVNDPGTSVEDNGIIPSRYELSQNYPNPFNPTTKIVYNIPQEGVVTLKVFNMIGQEVASLVNEIKSAGSHQINFNAKELASGMYIYRIQVGSFTSAKKMLLIK
ncbi:MAG: T9SS type A sorting domain-containing protein, partial [Melioribacteraceae bacterium]